MGTGVCESSSERHRFRYLQGYMGTSSNKRQLHEWRCLDTFKDMWEPQLPDADSTAKRSLDTFKDIWELVSIVRLCRCAQFRYLQGYMGTGPRCWKGCSTAFRYLQGYMGTSSLSSSTPLCKFGYLQDIWERARCSVFRHLICLDTFKDIWERYTE